ncbi:Hypothetical protein TART1_1734 [Trichococcus shcherbakoviae]|uniref:Uncharacterized protein n=2 Tax=Trichococcus shcherbakoviae TaxID=2094020 RepID=A0A383TG00_9LACT|nr:Hypothetical protein TART1_1734 [Trichococcus shcherbakoviae]
MEKANAARTERPDLNAESIQFRAISNDYTVPDDVCESYEAVYNMLAEVDAAYQN